jgi:hypothetical protein
MKLGRDYFTDPNEPCTYFQNFGNVRTDNTLFTGERGIRKPATKMIDLGIYIYVYKS